MGFLSACAFLKTALDFHGIAFIWEGLPLGTSLYLLRVMAGQKHVWMQCPWIKVAMGLKSNILLIAMRAEAQLAAHGAHNHQVMESHKSARRIHDAEL
jgi:hypothetical protein